MSRLNSFLGLIAMIIVIAFVALLIDFEGITRRTNPFSRPEAEQKAK